MVFVVAISHDRGFIAFRKLDLDWSITCIADVPWQPLTIFLLLGFKILNQKSKVVVQHMDKVMFNQMCKHFLHL